MVFSIQCTSKLHKVTDKTAINGQTAQLHKNFFDKNVGLFHFKKKFDYAARQ